MKNEICNHRFLTAKQKGFDIEATCETCNEKFYFHRAKEGLYTFQMNHKLHLLNTIQDINFETGSYSFEVDGVIMTLVETMSYLDTIDEESTVKEKVKTKCPF